LFGDSTSGCWYKHRSALVEIAELRGGFDTIEKEHLRITLTWYVLDTILGSHQPMLQRSFVNRADLIGCFAQDFPPVIPLPQRWKVDLEPLAHLPRPSTPISLVWKQRLPMQRDWITIFDDVAQLISLDQAFNIEQLMLANTTGSWMEPAMYRLLAIRPLLHSNNSEQVMEEVCRLGTLLFLSPFWRLLGLSPVRTAVISRNLLLVLTENRVDWNELRPLLVWVLYFAAIETKDLAERGQYVSMLAAVMAAMQLQEWDEIMQIVKGVLWVEKVFAGSDELIQDEMMQIINEQLVGALSTDTPTRF
jgi:hypothetical protein